ncbi:hypothetical protein [Kitasatospora sp. NPDC097643]|uniref:hypothetical protein n=1 Tax=Kitasatospora sp. NPDC097643 TaxID=3157230 RepID=UPI00332B25BF
MMRWQVESYERDGDAHLADHVLPGFTVADAARLVGDHPDLIGSAFPLDAGQVAAVSAVLGTELDPAAAAHFLIARAD